MPTPRPLATTTTTMPPPSRWCWRSSPVSSPLACYVSPSDKQESNHHESTNRFRSHAHRPGTGHPQARAATPLRPVEYWGHDLPAHFHPVLSDSLFLVGGLGDQESGRFVRHLRALVRPQLQSVLQSGAALYLQ